MIIRGLEIVDAYVRRYAQSKSSLASWQKLISSKFYKNFADLKRTFATASYVAPHVIFNISGNHHRLSAIIDYETGIAVIDHIEPHAEYDRSSRKGRKGRKRK